MLSFFGCYDTPAPYLSFAFYNPTRCNSFPVGWEQQSSLLSDLNPKSVNGSYGESSSPNKRPNMGNEALTEQSSLYPSRRRPTGTNGKDRNGVGKKIDATPLEGMIDKISGGFDKPVQTMKCRYSPLCRPLVRCQKTSKLCRKLPAEFIRKKRQEIRSLFPLVPLYIQAVFSPSCIWSRPSRRTSCTCMHYIHRTKKKDS